MKPAEENADAILDTGAEGLRYFEVFGPRYREWTGNEPAGGGYHSLAARYDQQRGMDLQPMRAVAHALADEVEGRLAGDADTQRARIAELPEHWNGSPAARDAAQFLADVGNRTRTAVDLLRIVHTTATTAIDDLEQVLRDKARAARTGFDADTSAGKTPQQIDWIIDIARQHGDTSSESVRKRLRDMLPEQYGEDADPQRVCRDWLDHAFVGEIDAKVTEFTALCSHAHTAVCEAYERLAHALQAVAAVGFVSPGGQPSHGSDLTYAGTDSAGALSVQQDQSGSVAQPQNREPSTRSTGVGAPSSLALTTTPASDARGDEPVDPGTPSGGDPSGGDPTEVTRRVKTLTPETAAAGDDAVGQGGAAEQDELDEQAESATQDDTAMSEQETGPDTSTASAEWTPDGVASVVTAASHITGTIPELVTAVGEVTGSLDEVITATGEAVSSVIGATGEAFPAVLDIDESPGAAPPDTEAETEPACDVPAGPSEPEPETATPPDECRVRDDIEIDDDPAPVEEPDETVTTTPPPEPAPDPGKTGAELPPPTEPLEFGTETAAIFTANSPASSVGVPHQQQGAVVSSVPCRPANANT